MHKFLSFLFWTAIWAISIAIPYIAPVLFIWWWFICVKRNGIKLWKAALCVFGVVYCILFPSFWFIDWAFDTNLIHAYLGVIGAISSFVIMFILLGYVRFEPLPTPVYLVKDPYSKDQMKSEFITII